MLRVCVERVGGEGVLRGWVYDGDGGLCGYMTTPLYPPAHL